MNTGFQKWCDKLLDTGKGNRLINYKDSSMRTIEILKPSLTEIFSKISNGNTLTFFDIDNYINKFKDDETIYHLIDKSKAKNKFDRFTKQQIIELVSPKLPKNQILSFKKGYSLRKILGNIKKIANTSLTEKGINILYMAFGFLSWTKSDTLENFNSPLILIPIVLESDSNSSPVTVKHYEDEITTNPTLLYKMEQEFGVKLPQYQENEFNEESLEEYFERVKKVVNKLDWSINYNVAIGTFSFLKLNMYQDLINNENTILANNNIKKLLNIRCNDNQNKNNSEIKNEEFILHNVVDADSSQISAILQAKSGNSFVLQGPPGTGKSQTITNLIAEFLFEGKKILFVSEKLAALNVVFNNLRKADLSDFCLELHSNKTNKKEVINELYRVLSGNRKLMKDSASFELDELTKTKNQLDTYVNSLHSVKPLINLTPYQILSKISKYNSAPSFEYIIEDIDKKNLEHLDLATSTIKDFINYSESIGYDYRENLWYGYNNSNLTYENKINIKTSFALCEEFLEKLLNKMEALKNLSKIEYKTLDSLMENLELLKKIQSLNFFDTSLFKIQSLRNLLNNITKYNTKINEIIANKKILSEKFNDEIYENKLKDIFFRFKVKYSSPFRFLSKNYRLDKELINSYLLNENDKLKYDDYIKYLRIGRDIQEAEKNANDFKNAIFNILKNNNINWEYDWIAIEKELTEFTKVLTKDFSYFNSADKETFRKIQKLIQDVTMFIDNSSNELETLNILQQSFDKEIVNFKTLEINKLLEKTSNYLTNFDFIENWVRFVDILNKIKEHNLLEFVNVSIKNNIPRKTLADTYNLMFYTQWIYYLINDDYILHKFSRINQDTLVNQFKKKDKLSFEISKAEIITKLNENMPNISNMASGSQVSTLVREANKKSKQKPVRLLLKDCGELIQELKPCFLMSPLSVSTYLDSDTCQFDVVIFDEASQIFPWDAIGSIYRAKQVIIVGDSKQMPPSNFFNAGIVEEDIDENFYEDDSLDFESILDLCSTIFPQNKLSWHYRSKTEDLISFSNKNFYNGNLVTFPSVNKFKDNIGVEFYYVSEGIFDRKSKSNIIEAEQVVDLVFKHFKTHPDRSLGVVAFSLSQQDAIEELIQKRRESYPQFESYFDSKKEEPFFVKNLETVQGDERDTIIFSVGYAKDIDGKFYHNFGPLNKKGGERRLNVAITRAKYNVKLVSSIKSYDINLEKTSATGAKLLKDYIYFAEYNLLNTKEDTIVENSNNLTSHFETEIFNLLKNLGYEVEMNVGCSDYKIDIALKHPKTKEYILAIECDGNTYLSGKTTRDRDRLRQEVLEKLGWKFYRIWSIDWFRNKGLEKKNLINYIENVMKNLNNNSINLNLNNNIETKNISFIEEVKENTNIESLFEKYEYYDIYSAMNKNIKLDDILFELIKKEQPLHEEQLLKEVVSLFDRQKVTNAVRDEVNYILRRHKDRIFKKGDFYYTDKDLEIKMKIPKPIDIPRNILMIEDKEIENGMHVIIKNNIGITKKGLFSTISTLLGFTHQGDRIQEKFSKCLDNLLKSSLIKEEDDEYFIN